MTQYQPLPLTFERLWQFSLQHYGVRKIKEACLHLQNQYHGKVNLVLLLKWLDEHQLALSEQQWQQLDAAIERTEHLLEQFRYYRRKAKPHLPDTLYRESLQFELQLERQQQSDLVHCINQMDLSPRSGQPMTHLYCHKVGAEHLCEIFYNTAR
ncbi:TIGR02444 family protein [Vibrio aphrogenes]|uniref:TIGR02444 family protein n=1 Tax=Vibrio aphrogenes TaxID=1891186 RepID=UPI000B355A86|nr:TIGR02444 family protein [Vibrio aphrogenes]